jgi:hypothetical protein
MTFCLADGSRAMLMPTVEPVRRRWISLVLSGDPGQGLASEVGKFLDCRISLGESIFQLLNLCLETFDLCGPGIRGFSNSLKLLDAVFELGAQVRVGPGAVEGGSVNPGPPAPRPGRHPDPGNPRTRPGMNKTDMTRPRRGPGGCCTRLPYLHRLALEDGEVIGRGLRSLR